MCVLIYLGNKTQCDICSSKAMKRARIKKERKEHDIQLPVEEDEPQSDNENNEADEDNEDTDNEDIDNDDETDSNTVEVDEHPQTHEQPKEHDHHKHHDHHKDQEEGINVMYTPPLFLCQPFNICFK